MSAGVPGPATPRPPVPDQARPDSAPGRPHEVGNLCARSGVAFPAREPAPWRQSRLIVRCVPAHTCQHQHPRSRTENLFLLLVSLRLRRPPLCCSVAAGPLAVVLVVVAVSLAGLRRVALEGRRGRRLDDDEGHSSAAQTPLADAVRFANCMRAHGVTNYPDPSSNGRSQSLNQIDPSSPTFLRAHTARQKTRRTARSAPRADSRPTSLCARVRPMPAQARVPAVPGSANDLWAPGFTLGRVEYFPDISTTELPVAGVHPGG